MTIAGWLSNVLHKSIDVDGYYGPQCVDLVNHYLRNVRAKPGFAGNAIDAKTAHIQGAVWTDNAPHNAPTQGDIVVWDYAPYGHVAVVLAADQNVLVSIDQNWNTIQRAEVVSHDYHHVLGWHHFA
jgi:surface antigen